VRVLSRLYFGDGGVRSNSTPIVLLSRAGKRLYDEKREVLGQWIVNRSVQIFYHLLIIGIIFTPRLIHDRQLTRSTFSVVTGRRLPWSFFAKNSPVGDTMEEVGETSSWWSSSSKAVIAAVLGAMIAERVASFLWEGLVLEQIAHRRSWQHSR
jgi:hypothetical protein